MYFVLPGGWRHDMRPGAPRWPRVRAPLRARAGARAFLSQPGGGGGSSLRWLGYTPVLDLPCRCSIPTPVLSDSPLPSHGSPLPPQPGTVPSPPGSLPFSPFPFFTLPAYPSIESGVIFPYLLLIPARRALV